MDYCQNCGNPVPENDHFCRNCGSKIHDFSTAHTQYPNNSSAQENRNPGHKVIEQHYIESEEVPDTEIAINDKDTLEWSKKIPLITNPYMVFHGFAIPLGVCIALGLLFWLITGAMEMMEIFLVVGVFLAILFNLIILVLQVVTKGGLETTFYITRKGIGHKAGSDSRKLNRVSTIGSILGGSVTGAGAGMLAISQENNYLSWKEVKYIAVYPNIRSLVFRSPLLISPVALYCTEENYVEVLAIVKEFAPNHLKGKLDLYLKKAVSAVKRTL